MIALLTGAVAGVDADRCVLDVNGVGYLVHASTRTLSALSAAPAPVRVLVETLVREDAILLYGFADADERDWFRVLTAVQGVGAKVALNILSALSPRDLVAAIGAGDRGALTRASGVGAKLAVRLLSELRDRAATMPASGGTAAAPALSGPADEALSALGNLGYRRTEAQAAVERVVKRLGDDAKVEAVLRETLRELAPGGSA